MVDHRNMPVEDLIRSKPQNEEEFTDQLSSHFKLRIVEHFKSLQKKSALSFDLLFGTVLIKLITILFLVVEKKYHASKINKFKINCHLCIRRKV